MISEYNLSEALFNSSAAAVNSSKVDAISSVEEENSYPVPELKSIRELTFSTLLVKILIYGLVLQYYSLLNLFPNLLLQLL